MRLVPACRRLAAGCLTVAVLVSMRVDAQILLDRVLARVNGASVTLSDVRAARAMGLVMAGPDETDFAAEQWIQRLLLLLEVERFPPPEPAAAAVDQEEARMRAQMGPTVATLAAQTGLDERQIRQSARDTLRIRAYLDQRFGGSAQDTIDQWMTDLRRRADVVLTPIP
ncbi:MAG: hypothetical protein ABL986_22695 [Vicinamibacterales bacterium]